MDSLMEISRDTGIPILEDCSHAHGARFRGRPVGSLGKVGAWSLQGSKPVSAGEGGVLATDDPDVFERACLAGQVNRLGGLDLVTEKYRALQPLGLGMKFRAHPLGIGLAGIQLAKLGRLNERRREYVEAVETRLRALPGLSPVEVHPQAERGGFYAFPVLHSPEAHGGTPTDRLRELLVEEGLNVTGSPYGLLHRLKIFAEGFDLFTGNRGPLCGDYAGYREGDFPITEDVQPRLVFLPMLSDPVPDAVDRIMDMILRALSRIGLDRPGPHPDA
jgi:dTDP-4-amino-4,6-dideoxygalactose transaminase